MLIEKPIIYLYRTYGIGMVISYPSGVFYANQTGGIATTESFEEGVFVPLFIEGLDQEGMLREYFTGPIWRRLCGYNIDRETANYVDHVLQLSPGTSFIRTDRSKLNISHEAWVYVDILEIDNPIALVLGFGNRKGVLTWSNSD